MTTFFKSTGHRMVIQKSYMEFWENERKNVILLQEWCKRKENCTNKTWLWCMSVMFTRLSVHALLIHNTNSYNTHTSSYFIAVIEAIQFTHLPYFIAVKKVINLIFRKQTSAYENWNNLWWTKLKFWYIK